MNQDEQQIRTLIASWADAVHAGDLETVVAAHAVDIVMFDVPPPYDGVEASRPIAPPGRPSSASSSRASFEIVSLDVTAGQDVAYAHALLRCGTPQELAEKPENRLRLTLGLRKEDGRWVVAPEHHLIPARRLSRRRSRAPSSGSGRAHPRVGVERGQQRLVVVSLEVADRVAAERAKIRPGHAERGSLGEQAAALRGRRRTERLRPERQPPDLEPAKRDEECEQDERRQPEDRQAEHVGRVVDGRLAGLAGGDDVAAGRTPAERSPSASEPPTTGTSPTAPAASSKPFCTDEPASITPRERLLISTTVSWTCLPVHEQRDQDEHADVAKDGPGARATQLGIEAHARIIHPLVVRAP